METRTEEVEKEVLLEEISEEMGDQTPTIKIVMQQEQEKKQYDRFDMLIRILVKKC